MRVRHPFTLVCLTLAACAVAVPAAVPATPATPTPLALTTPVSPSTPGTPSTLAAPSDLDRFMERVLATRDENWKKLQQYVLEERETLRVQGPGGVRVNGFQRDYTWFVRDGFFVRSPISADGVTISEGERRRYEEDWIRRERRRERRRAEREAREAQEAQAAAAETSTGEPLPAASLPAVSSPAVSSPAVRIAADAADAAEAVDEVDDVLRQSVEPQFVSAAYFLRFKFDPGQYALVGRERLDDRDVLKIEYYPTRLFDEGRARPNRRVRDREDEIEEKLNKVSVVTLWIDPVAHQIVRYTLDDLDMDFLPGRSLVRVDRARASMRMGEPFPGVWLPDTVETHFRLTLALGSVDAAYEVSYHDYRQASVSVKVKQ